MCSAMKSNSEVTQPVFDAFLIWLDRDPTLAGPKYEEIRGGLERYFRFRGCGDPMALTDETINRVAAKINELDLTKNVKKITIFYGFATNVYREHLRNIGSREYQLKDGYDIPSAVEESEYGVIEETEVRMGCLGKCLNKLPELQRELVVEYYAGEKTAKIEHRKWLADRYELEKSALRVQIHRIKNGLRGCVKLCVEKKL